MVRPELSELQQIKKTGCYKTAPVSMEILSDLKTPIEVLKILQCIRPLLFTGIYFRPRKMGPLYLSGL